MTHHLTTTVLGSESQELVGCILLEKFKLRVSDERMFEFSIAFEQYSQSEISFRARSSTELQRWREILSSCCHEYTRAVHVRAESTADHLAATPIVPSVCFLRACVGSSWQGCGVACGCGCSNTASVSCRACVWRRSGERRVLRCTTCNSLFGRTLS